MIEVKIPKEITEYSEKIIFGLSLRQMVVVGLGIPTIIGTFIFSKTYLGEDFASYVVMLVCIPFFSVGFVKKENMYFEKYLELLIRHKFGAKRRFYATELIIGQKEIKEEEVKKNGTTKKKSNNNRQECTISNEYKKLTKKQQKQRRKEYKKEVERARKEVKEARSIGKR